MRSALPVLLLLLCGFRLGAQKSGTQPPEAKPKALSKARITGQVLCGDTRRPARGALVLLQPLSDKQDSAAAGMQNVARVAMDGTYVLDHVSAGSYAVLALMPGYLSPLDGLDASGFNSNSEPKLRKALAGYNTVTVQENGTATRDLVLERGAAVSGRVLYPDGSPASQVNLKLEDVSRKDDSKATEPNMNVGLLMRTMFTHQSTATDDQGHFRVSGIPPGTYRLSATPVPELPEGNDGMGVIMMMGMVDIPGLLRVYAGDTLHRKDAKTFTLRGGEEVGDLQITLPINSFHAVTGHLTAKDGRPLSTAELRLTDTTDDALVFQTALGEDGTFRFPAVPPGSYLLSASGAQIMKPNPNLPAAMALQQGTPAAAFADGSAAVLVKDSDVTDVSLALTETALKPVPAQAEQDQPEP